MTRTAMREAMGFLPKRQAYEGDGLAGWLLKRLTAKRDRMATKKRNLCLVETLSLGGRRQLMLIDCGGQRYLVGCGTESVESIVPVAGSGSPAAELPSEDCR